MNRLIILMVAMAFLSGSVCPAWNDMFGGRTDYEVGDAPEGIIAADLDGDGDYDLSVANKGPIAGQGGSLAVLINNGDGTFQPPVKFAGGRSYYSLTAADFDHDGDLDLAVANRQNWYVSVLLNNGDGRFEPSFNYAAGNAPSWIYSSDLDEDGYHDLAVSNALSTEVSVLLNKGDGTFHARVNYPVSESGQTVFIADLDGDGDNDLSVGTVATLDILLNNGDGSFQAYEGIGPGMAPGYIYAADLDNDDDFDLAAAQVGGDSVIVFHNHGKATFDSGNSFSVGSSPTSVFAIDLNRDGNIDLTTANNSFGTISVLLNNGDGSFQAEGEYAAGDRSGALWAADFDGDSDDDLAVTNSASDNITVYFNLTYTGYAALDFDTLNSVWAYPPDPIDAFIFVGGLEGGYAVEDIDPFSVTINGHLNPSSFAIISDHPEITGEVAKMTFDLRAFIAGYVPLWDTEPQIYTVSGQYTDATPFAVGGDIVIIGLNAGDANLDGRVDIGDPVFIIDYLFREGLAPQLDVTADANYDLSVDVADALYLLNYIFAYGSEPLHP